MRAAKTGIAVAVLAAAAGLVWATSHASTTEPGRSGRLQPELQPSGPAPARDEGSAGKGEAEEMKRLKARLSALESEVTEVKSAARGVDEATREGEAEEAARPAVEQDPEEAATQLAHALDERLDTEPVDPEWKGTVSNKLTTYFAAEHAAGSSVKKAECRSTMCRVEVAHESMDAKDRFVDHVSSMLPPRSQAFVHIEANDDLDIEVYVLREGQSFPTTQM